MPLIPDVVSGQPIQATWGNAIRNQTVQVCTSATRPVVLTDGMSWYETDTGRLMLHRNGITAQTNPYVVGQHSCGAGVLLGAGSVDLTWSVVPTWSIPAGKRWRLQVNDLGTDPVGSTYPNLAILQLKIGGANYGGAAHIGVAAQFAGLIWEWTGNTAIDVNAIVIAGRAGTASLRLGALVATLWDMGPT